MVKPPAATTTAMAAAIQVQRLRYQTAEARFSPDESFVLPGFGPAVPVGAPTIVTVGAAGGCWPAGLMASNCFDPGNGKSLTHPLCHTSCAIVPAELAAAKRPAARRRCEPTPDQAR